MQHNCVECYNIIEHSARGSQSYYVYSANLGSTLMLLRLPRVLHHVSEERGEMAQAMVTALAEHGRLKLDQLIRYTRDLLRRVDGSEPHTSDEIRNAFIGLVNEHYVERSPPCSLPPPHIAPHAQAKQNKRGAKPLFEVDMTARNAEIADYDRQRFELPVDILTGHDTAGAEAALVRAAGRKRKGDERETSSSDLLWRLNYR